ncbi:MAG: cytoplasmic protein [Clostridium sp. SCN 57-10]|nr:MAG: cytoplasmic protein [Clostridium sp. SCN 57-10]
MTIRTIEKNGEIIATVESGEQVITDVSSALDLIATVYYQSGSSRIIVSKASVAEDFFILSSRLAGDILQKFINYRAKLAIVGDYSKYTSKPLRDFIYESNNGHDIFFVATEDEAVEQLSRA